MSRTIKGSKGAGYEFWSKRPYSGFGHGKYLKTMCHRKERREKDVEVRWEVDEMISEYSDSLCPVCAEGVLLKTNNLQEEYCTACGTVFYSINEK